MAEIQRRKTPTVKIGHVRVGWEVPVVVQSMTNTDTADIPGTVWPQQPKALPASHLQVQPIHRLHVHKSLAHASQQQRRASLVGSRAL